MNKVLVGANSKSDLVKNGKINTLRCINIIFKIYVELR